MSGLDQRGYETDTAEPPVALVTIAREWTRIGVIGFGGPPAHIALLRTLCVQRRGWLTAAEFEDGIAATNLLPGPSSTQLAILCGWRLRGALGALIGGACFITPGLIVILGLAALFLGAHPPRWVLGAAAGAGAAVPAVAAHAAAGLVPASLARAGTTRAARARWAAYVAAGATAAAAAGPWLVFVLVGCGLLEAATKDRPPTGTPGDERRRAAIPVVSPLLPVVAAPAVAGGVAAIAWMAAKVGALSYGGGFVIIPLMRHDAVDTHHWMTGAQFLDAVALGQVTPGPVVHTVAVVGYAAAGMWGGLLAALMAFGPSFAFVLAGGRHFDRLRASPRIQSFLTGAGPAAIGAIAGTTVPLLLTLDHLWQYGLLVPVVAWLFGLRRGVVPALLGAAVLGVVAALAGAPLSA
ncbi:MAG TPA: chromate efflux transporter [Actinomadura sp.]|nr:chromate efflux transporter [Actinomadura sp.]